MVIYITTTGELTKNQKLLASLPATDMVYILYTEKEASIPIEAYQMLSSLKCKVQFMQWSDNIDAQLKFMFNLGIICGENKNTGVRVLSNNNWQFAKVFSDKPARKRTASTKITESKTETKPVKEKSSEEFMPAPIPVQKNTETPAAEPTPEKKRRRRKSKQDEEFDKQYDELIALFNEVKTKEFDPTGNMYGIIKAVKASITEGTDLKESFKLWFTNNSGKIIKAFEGKEDRLKKIVGNLNDEVK